MSDIPVALQLYTVRDQLEKDFAGTVKAVAEMGYDAVELAGTGGLSAADLKALLSDCGLAIVGSHVGIHELEGEIGPVLDYNNAIGNPHIVIPWMPEERRGSADDWKKLGGTLEAIGQKVKDAGMTLCYHNHAFEFEVKEGDAFGLDLLYQNADADLLKIEMDTYWLKAANLDPAQYLTPYADRTPLVHLKDMTEGDDPTFAPVGTGIMDFDAIVQAADKSVVKAWIVEQDRCEGPSMEAAETSLGNVRTLLARQG